MLLGLAPRDTRRTAGGHLTLTLTLTLILTLTLTLTLTLLTLTLTLTLALTTRRTAGGHEVGGASGQARRDTRQP